MTLLKILTAMLAFIGGQAVAEEGAYQIELIAFSQAMPTTEVFEQTASQLSWPSDLTEPSAYHQPASLALADSYAALSQDSAYRPLLHVAWIQPLGAGGLSAPVRIQSADGKLTGYVRLQQGPGLLLLVDVELAADSVDGAGVVYRLNEKRPVKLDGIYYLDHPKFGLVVKVIQG
ncbi:MAG: CsiV family protein [Methylobacter sp.]|nr:CsiV family protein [Methylobacter sp.]